MKTKPTHTHQKKIIQLKVAITAPKLEVEVLRVWHCYSWHCLQPQTFSCSCLPSPWWGLWMDNNSDTGGQDSSLLQLFLSSSTVCHSIGNVGSDIPLLPVVKYYIYFMYVCGRGRVDVEFDIPFDTLNHTSLYTFY